MSSFMVEIVAGLAVLGKAFSKILLSVLGVGVCFLYLPKTRTARALLAAFILAVVCGILLHMYGTINNLNDYLTHLFSFLAGFFSFAMLAVMARLHVIISEDDELVDAAYNWLRKWFIKGGKK
jgi:hypothetical protein